MATEQERPDSPLVRAWRPEFSAKAAAAADGGELPKATAKLTLPDGRSFDLPMLEGTIGPAVIDIRNLYAQAGVFTYDPGFTSTAACDSTITYIDGPAGLLLHRGYRIEELAEKSDFEEVTFLLLYGHLPSTTEKEQHSRTIKKELMVNQKLLHFYEGFKSDAHPMAIMVGVMGALSAFFMDSLDIRSAKSRMLSAYRVIGKISTIAAMAYKASIGQPFVYPRKELTYAENFLYMLFAEPTEPYTLNPVVVRCMETFLILHADHEQNASTSTVRIAGSAQANPFACIASGITALWGPAHGGANEAVLEMLGQIGNKANIPLFLEKAKDKKDPFRLMGFGHRVYKNYDPRAKIMKEMCHKVLRELNIQNEPLFDLAMELERIALSDDYFIKRQLFPNVDFYSGIVLKAIGIPVSMYTVLFAVARASGWIAQWKEMIEDPQQKICRPRQLFLGELERPYVLIEDRPDAVVLSLSPYNRVGSTPANVVVEPSCPVSSSTTGQPKVVHPTEGQFVRL